MRPALSDRQLAGWAVVLGALLVVPGLASAAVAGRGIPDAPEGAPVPPSQWVVPLAAPDPAAGGPSVVSTIALSNGSLMSGNVRLGNGQTPYAVAYDATHQKIYVGNWGTQFLTVVDAVNRTVVGYIPVNTTGVFALLVAGGSLYVMGFNLYLVQVVNLSLGRVTTNITLGVGPTAMAWDSVHDRVLISTNTRPWALVAVSNQNFTVEATQSVRNSPGAVVYDPVDDRILVGDGGNNLAILNGTTLQYITNLTIGYDPWAGIWDPSNDLAYIANQESDNVSIVDPAAETIVDHVQIGGEPSALALDASGRWLYVPSGERNNVTRIDTTAPTDPLQHLAIPVGPAPVGITYVLATGEGVTVSFTANTLTFFNGSTGVTVATVANGLTPQGEVFVPPTNELYISESSGGNVYVWNVTEGRVSDVIPSPGSPTQLLYDPTSGRVLVLRSSAGLVSEIDPHTHAILTSIAVVGGATSIALDAEDDRLFVSDTVGGWIDTYRFSNGTPSTPINVTTPTVLRYCGGTGLIYAVDGAVDNQIAAIAPLNGTILANGTIGLIGTSILCDPFGDRVFVTNQRTQNVSVLDGTTLAGLDSLFVGAGGTGADYDTLHAEVTVSDAFDNTVSVLGAVNRSSVATVAVGVSPGPVVYVPTIDTLLVGNAGSGTVSMVAPGAPLPVLRSLAISPPVLSAVEGEVDPILATPTSDYGVPLIAGVNYSWSLTPSSLGSVSPIDAARANFTAGTSAGVGYLSVNATYRGAELRATIPLQVVGPSTIPLASAAFTPSSVHLLLGAPQAFYVSAVLVGGAPSPPSTVFVWSVSPLSLGVLNRTSGDSVTFTGTSVGSGTLGVAAYYAGSSAAASAQVVVNASAAGPTLSYVRIAPNATSVTWGGSAQLTATAVASDGSDVTNQTSFSWSLATPRHGSIRFTSGPSEIYLAPYENASDVLTVTGSLAGAASNASAVLTVSPPVPNGTGPTGTSPSNPWSVTRLGLPTWAWLLLGAAAVSIGAWSVWRLRGRPPSIVRAEAFPLEPGEFAGARPDEGSSTASSLPPDY